MFFDFLPTLGEIAFRRELKKKLVAAVLVCLILAFLISAVFIITHERRHCVGVCSQLTVMKSTLRQTGMCEACGMTFLYLSAIVILNASGIFFNKKSFPGDPENPNR